MTSILKKAKRICQRRTKGAISIFLVIVLLANMLFGSFFIEAARILMIRRVVRNAADSAARSALSYYDERLASEYGLFAVERGVAEEAFERYFRSNILLSGNDGFDILRLSLPNDAVKVTLSKPIWEQETMIRSMGEYAKYRAVVNNTIGLLEKLNDLFKGGDTTKKVFNAANTAKTDLQKLKDDVKELSNSARASFHSAVERKSKDAKKDVTKALCEGKDPTPQERGFDDMKSEIDSAERTARDGIEQKRQEYDQSCQRVTKEFDASGGGSVDYYDETTGTWKQSGEPPEDNDYKLPADYKIDPSEDAEKEKTAVSNEAERARQQLGDKQETINQNIEKVKKCNEEIETHQQNMDNIQKEIDEIKPRVEEAQRDVDKKWRTLNELLDEKADDPYNYVFDRSVDDIEEYWTFQEELWTLREMERTPGASPLDIQIQRGFVESALEALKGACEDAGITMKHAKDDEIERAQAELGAASDKLSARQAEKAEKEGEYNAEEQAKREKEAERDRLIQEIENLYDEIPIEQTTATEWDTTYPIPKESADEVESDEASFLDLIMEAFEKVSDELQKTDVPSDNPNGFNKDVLKDAFSFKNMLSDIFGTVDYLQDTMSFLGKLLFDHDGLQEAFLFSNYVMETHTFLTSQTSRGNRYFQAGEVEYIMASGYTSQAMCIGQTLKNIALLRLLINWVYYMSITQLPPISRISVSLARASIRTIKDMREMIFIIDKNVKTASCPLCPKLDWVKVTYSEHLYVAMLIQACDDKNGGDRAAMLKRMRTMMKDTYQVQKWNKDKTPDEYLNSLQTKINAEVAVETNLILLNLPIFRSMLPKDNQVLNSGKFTVRESVSLSY